MKTKNMYIYTSNKKKPLILTKKSVTYYVPLNNLI